jgi:glycosyltransferase involved in cell wall biosynthesis
LFNYRVIYGYLPGTVYCYLHLFFTKKFDVIVSCSETVSNEIKRFKIINDVIITNSVDSSFNGLKRKSEIRKELKLDDTGRLFLTISSKLPGKNIEFLLNVFEKHYLNSNKRLLVAGYVDEIIREKYSSSAVIRFLGRVNNIIDYLRGSDFFVSASLSEGMPNAVLEAMEAGLPVILSDIQAHQEIFRKTEKPLGLIFKNNNVGDLISKISQIGNMDYLTLSNNCRITVEEHFNAKTMSYAYQLLYLNATNSKKKS